MSDDEAVALLPESTVKPRKQYHISEIFRSRGDSEPPLAALRGAIPPSPSVPDPVHRPTSRLRYVARVPRAPFRVSFVCPLDGLSWGASL
jgi:hypothetical protein